MISDLFERKRCGFMSQETKVSNAGKFKIKPVLSSSAIYNIVFNIYAGLHE